MTSPNPELITACLDGEPVDPDELARLLNSAEARDLVCDLLVLRAATGADEREPSREFYEHVRNRMPGSPLLSKRRPRGARPALRALVAAAALLAAMLAGWGLHGLAPEFSTDGAVSRADATEDPPEPTRVVRFERGVDWER
jgi:hypothetical protein